MPRRTKRRLRPDILWVAALLTPILLSVWWIPGRSGGGNDSFSADPAGKSILYELCASLLPDVRRSELVLPPPGVDTLCILGPTRYPHAGEWERLYEWVAKGHNLVFAARHDDPEVTIEPFEMRIVSGSEYGEESDEDEGASDLEDETGQEEEAASQEEGSGAGDLPWGPSREIGGTISTELVEGPIAWRSRAFIESTVEWWDEDGFETLLTQGELPQIVSLRVGQGALVVASSDRLFSNYALARERSELLACRVIAQAHEGGTLAFDESLNAGAPKTVGLLFDPLFRPITLQLLLCCVVFFWMGSRRFGATIFRSETRRRSIVEHARALGNLHFKASTGAHAVAAYLDYFRHELRLHYVSRNLRESLVALTRPTRFDDREILKLVDDAIEVSGKTGKVTAGRAAAIVRALASVKHALDSSKGD